MMKQLLRQAVICTLVPALAFGDVSVYLSASVSTNHNFSLLADTPTHRHADTAIWLQSQALAARPLLRRLAPGRIFKTVTAHWKKSTTINVSPTEAAQRAQLRWIYAFVALGAVAISGTLFWTAWSAAGRLKNGHDWRIGVVYFITGWVARWIWHALTPRQWRANFRKLQHKSPDMISIFNPTEKTSFEEWVHNRRPEDIDDAEHGEIHYHRAIWISDLHVGTEDFVAEKLLRFLRHNKAPILYINGDFIGWTEIEQYFRSGNEIPWSKKNNEVFQKLLRETKKGTQVVILPGNHDPFFGDLEGKNLDGFTFVSEADHITATGARLWVDHGNRYDLEVLNKPWLKHLGTWGKKAAYLLNELFNAVRKKLGLPPISLSGYLQEHVDDSPNIQASYLKCLMTQAAADGKDGVIGAHIHKFDAKIVEVGLFGNDTPKEFTIDEEDFFYGNPGDGVKNFTALVESGEGYFRNVPFDPRDKIDASRAYGPPILVQPRYLLPQVWDQFDVSHIQLLATDKDNTLLREREDPPPETLRLLEDFHLLAGHASFGIFTGDDAPTTDRQLMNRFSGSLKECSYSFTDGGGTGYAPNNEFIFQNPMPEDVKQELYLTVMETLHKTLQGTLGTELRITVDDLKLDNKVAGFSIVPAAKDVMERIRDHHAEGWAKLTAAVQQAINNDPKLSLTGYHAIDSATGIDLLKIDKGDALLFLAGSLAKQRGVSVEYILSRAVALGDSPNDIPMLNLVAQAGGRAFWVGESIPHDLGIAVIRLKALGPVGFRQVLRSLNVQLRHQGKSDHLPASPDHQGFEEVAARAA